VRRIHNIGRALIFAAVAIALCDCAGSLGISPSSSSPAANPERAGQLLRALRHRDGIDKIQHIVVVIQENRSFDNLFQGFPGADTQSYGYNSNNQKIPLAQIGLQTTWDLDHEAEQFFLACNGTGSYPGTDCRMNGFNNEYVYCGHESQPACPNANPPYAYVPHYQTIPYFNLATQYVLADHMFASNFDASSFVAHQYLIAAQSSSAVNFPSTTDWGCEGGPSDVIQLLTQRRTLSNTYIPVCLNNQTLGDELDAVGLSWRYYTAVTPHGNGGYWSAYSAIRHIYYGPDWKKDVITPQTVFFNDVANGNLPAVSWITPTCQNSDHAGCGGDTGPDWVASLVNAIGKSKYWDSTAIFVTWDDPGGWYDHVPPKMLDYDGLGMRVPLLVISPYAKRSYVSHVHYELASIDRFIEDRFGLQTLSASDARAISPEKDCFDFNQSPRPFRVIRTKHKEDYFIHQPLDLRPVDTQ
jgi:phospholipase C